MQFIIQTGLCLCLLFGVLASLAKERAGTALTAVGITVVMLAKHLWQAAVLTLLILGVGMFMAHLAAGRRRVLNGAGSFVSSLAGSLILLLVFGIFFGPAASLILWLLLSGLQLLPQFKSQTGAYLFNTIWRSSMAAAWLGLGLYAVYKG